MSWEGEKERARMLLGQSPLSHVSQVVWHTITLAGVWTLVDALFSKPHTLGASEAWENLIGAFICILLARFMVMLLAAGKLRKIEDRGEDNCE